MTNENKPTDSSLVVDQAGGNNVEQIRDILFGGQMRDYDQRFSRLEDKMIQENVRLMEDLSARIDSLDKFMRRELLRHSVKLQQERKERLSDVQEITQTLQALDNDLSAKIQLLDDEMRGDFAEIRQELRDEVAVLQTKYRQQREMIMHNLESETDKLRVDKVSHRVLSGLFSELGMRLNGDFPLMDE